MEENYKGHRLIEQMGVWCVSLGLDGGWKCFETVEEARKCVDEEGGKAPQAEPKKTVISS
jgi:hypothetical protein